MTETQRDECLVQLVKSVDKLGNRMDNLDSRMDKFENRMDNFENRMDNFENKLNENIAFTQRISESVAVMEVEHGSKLNALFDGYKANSEKLDKIETDIQNIHTILQKHDDQLYLINSR